MKNTILAIFLLSTLVACSSEPEDTSHIHGTWKAISWTVNGEPTDRADAGVSFEFKADATYTAAFGQQGESGTYRLSDGHLYTTAEDKIEKMVKINLPHPDTMVMDMNRVGTPEVIRLVKE